MKTIMLFCSAGMSTSLLVSRMQDAAVESGENVEIFAVAAAEFKDRMKSADVCLLGPQVRYMLKDALTEASSYGIPVEVISTVDYGMIDGKAVLKHALSLIGKDS